METNEEYKSFTVSIEFDCVHAKTPLEAAKIVAKWLVEDGGNGNAYDMIYDVKDEDTSEEYIVDLSNNEVEPKN